MPLSTVTWATPPPSDRPPRWPDLHSPLDPKAVLLADHLTVIQTNQSLGFRAHRQLPKILRFSQVARLCPLL
uniref:Uncharacterized protein n=1 Tax=Anguilla anguilla TaxID=7936 RepID=A0A0E9T4M0_ANGAN